MVILVADTVFKLGGAVRLDNRTKYDTKFLRRLVDRVYNHVATKEIQAPLPQWGRLIVRVVYGETTRQLTREATAFYVGVFPPVDLRLYVLAQLEAGLPTAYSPKSPYASSVRFAQDVKECLRAIYPVKKKDSPGVWRSQGVWHSQYFGAWPYEDITQMIVDEFGPNLLPERK